MAFLNGKFARFSAAVSPSAPAPVAGPFRWAAGFKRERLDTTNFESAVSASGNNVHTEGDTGPLDTTFTVEGLNNTTTINLFFPDSPLLCDLLFRKSVALGYKNVSADVLSCEPTVELRQMSRFTAQLQSNGIVNPAA